MGKKRAASEGSDDSLVAKKTKKETSSRETKKDADGNDFWELTDKRRVTVSQFKNQQLVSVREYYEQNGDMKPGKKGISLTVAQFGALIEALPAIEASLKAAGQSLPRPEYDGAADGGREIGQDEEIPDAGGEDRAGAKKNFEETSDEEG